MQLLPISCIGTAIPAISMPAPFTPVPSHLRDNRRSSGRHCIVAGSFLKQTQRPACFDRVVVSAPADQATRSKMIEDVPRPLVFLAERDQSQAFDRIEQKNTNVVEFLQGVIEFGLSAPTFVLAGLFFE